VPAGLSLSLFRESALSGEVMAHRQATQNMVEAEMLDAKFRMFGYSLKA
jgi:hypothetical protein